MRYLAIVIALLITAPGVLEARELSLEEAMRLAREHSFRIRQARQNAVAAHEAHRAAIAERFPTASASANATYVSEVATLDMTLPPPINYSFSRDMGSNESYLADVRLSLPLYTGGRLSGAIDRAGATVEYQKALEEAQVDRVCFDTRLAWLGLARADRTIASAEASLRRVTVTADDVRSLYDAGAADSTDLLEVDIALTGARFALTAARNARRSEEIKLLSLLGLGASETIEITQNLSAPRPHLGNASVTEDKPELRASNANIDLRLAELKLSHTGYLPTLSAFTGYAYGKPNLDPFNDRWNGFFTVGAGLSWSFNLGGRTKSESRAARSLLQAARELCSQTAEDLNRESSLQLEQLRLSYDRYEAERERHRLSADNYRLAQQKHRRGVLSSNRLLEIEATLTEAEASLAAATVDYHIAQSAYYYASGSDQLREGF